MIGRTSPQQNRKLQQKPQQGGGLLSSRILNALPYTESVKDYYLRTKQRNEVLRIGLNFAEACASTAATPFLSKYEALDKFAGKQLDKLEEQYGENLIAKSVGAAVYPIGFTLGLAGYARNKVLDVANPAIQMSYEWADVVVDNLLPPDYDETMEDEYRRMKNLQLKSPMSRIRERTNLHSIRLLPSNAFKFSWHVFSSAAYMGMGITTMSLERMMNTVNLLLGKINFVFEEVLEHPWTAISNTDFAKLYHSMAFYGVRSVIGYINEVEKLALELSDYLENRNLTYNAEVVGFLANKIKLLERRLVRLGGVIQESNTQELKAQPTSTPRKVEGHRPRMIMNTPRRVVAPDQRIPSMLLGESSKPSLAQEKEVVEVEIEIEETQEIEESEPAEPEHKDEAKHQIRNSMFNRVSANRAKYSSKMNAKRLAAKQQATLEKAKHLEITKSQKKEIVEEPVDPNVDEYGFAPVRPKAHDHLLPASVAKEIGKEMLLKPHQKRMPVTPANSPADALNNPFAPIGVSEDKIVAGPTALVNLNEVEQHQKGLKHKALHEMLKVVSEKLLNDEGAQRAERHAELPVWQEAKHPVHKHHEAPAPKLNEDELPASENNPFGKLVEADQDPFSIGVSSM